MEETTRTLEQVMDLAEQLSPLDKLRLIERLSRDVAVSLQAPLAPRRRSLRGLLRGYSITEEEIEQARREMWGNFPREDL
jgi:hypothetical protein